MTNGSSPRKSRAISTQWARPSGASCWMYVTRTSERRAVADGRLDLGVGLADDDADLLDAGLGHVLDAVEQDRLVRHRDELLGRRVRDGPQAGAGAAGQDETLHGGRG